MLQRISTAAFTKHLITLLLFTTLVLLFNNTAAAEADSRVAEVYPQSAHTFILTENGSLWAWGDNRNGKLGDGTTTNRAIPIQLVLDNVASLYPQSSGHTFALKTDGTLWAWERNWDGRIGAGPGEPSYSEPAKILDNTEKLFPHERHSFALKTDGTLWAWGNNSHGQLGDGTTTNRFAPVKVSLDNVSKVYPKNNSSYALLEDGTLWAWGHNQYGKLGDGTTANRRLPVQVLDQVSTVYPQSSHVLAQKNDHTLWGWGYNWYGQLGDGTNENRHRPVRINLDRVEELFPQKYHSFALKDDGSLWAWGYNWYGQLGDGTILNRNEPVPVNVEGASALYPRQDHTFMLLEDKSLWAWGRSSDGRLGGDTGSTLSIPEPVKITDGVEEAFVLEKHAFTLDQGGTPSAWGKNDRSRLGSNSEAASSEPETIPLENVARIFPQENHTFALKEDGSLWAWGSNSKGQLGIGSFQAQAEPTQVLLGDNLPFYTIALSTEPGGAGTLSGGGTYRRGESISVNLSANQGYTFINWTEDGEEISTDTNLSFLAVRDRLLVANFDAPGDPEKTEEEEITEEESETFEIALDAEPEDGGTVSGGGDHETGTEITVRAEAADNYTFTNWTEDDKEVSNSEEFVFTVNSSRALTANFDLVEEEIPLLFEIKLNADPEKGGTVSGTGTYQADEEITVSAAAEEGYRFSKWTEHIAAVEEDEPEAAGANNTGDEKIAEGEELYAGSSGDASEDADYRFTVDRNRALTAIFEEIEAETDPALISSILADNGEIVIIFDRDLETSPGGGDFAASYSYEINEEADHSNPESNGNNGDENSIDEADSQAHPDAGESNNGAAREREREPEDDHLGPAWKSFDQLIVNWSDQEAERAILNFEPFSREEETIRYTVQVSYRDGEAFEAEPFTVEALVPTYNLTVKAEPEDSGTVSGEGIYEEGHPVIVVAEAAEGRAFINWTDKEGAEVSTDASFEYTMPDEDIRLTANFETLEYTLNLVNDPAEGGRADGSGTYAAGEEVTLSAAADEGYEFVAWIKGDQTLGIEPELTYTMPARDNTIVVIFDLEIIDNGSSSNDDPEDQDNLQETTNGQAGTGEIYYIEVNYDHENSGTVKGEGYYESGDNALVVAEPPAGFVFYCWFEDDTPVSFDASYVFPVTRDRVLTAKSKQPTGEEIDHNQPDPENGDDHINGTNGVTAGADEQPDAPGSYTVSLSIEPEDSGSVEGAGLYGENELVGLNAYPAIGYEFTGWMEDDTEISIAKTYAFTVSRDRDLVAVFTPLLTRQNEIADTFRISLAPAPLEGGRVYGSGEYTEGTTVTVSALPDIDYYFLNWTSNGIEVSKDVIYNFTADRDYQLTANFISLYNDDLNEPLSNQQNFERFLSGYFADFLVPHIQYNNKSQSAIERFGFTGTNLPPMGGGFE